MNRDSTTRDTLVAGRLRWELVWREGMLDQTHLEWAGAGAATRVCTATGEALARELERYVRGERVAWPALAQAVERLSPFARGVLGALREHVGWGQLATYGGLAALAGSPRAGRAVGRVMNTNPWPLVVPCHRVVGAGGHLVGFGGAGLGMKTYLLELEGHRIRNERVAPPA